MFIFAAQTSVSMHNYVNTFGQMELFLCVVLFTVFHAYCRGELKKLIVRLNEEKKILKEEGITVDGIHYKVSFKGT